MSIPRPWLVPALLLVVPFHALTAADVHADHVHDDVAIPRLVVQVLGGTAGIEPGIAAEWRCNDGAFLLRPEILLSEDGRVGGGASVAWDLAWLRLPERHAITLGPRVVYHHSDDTSWEADAQAVYSFDFLGSPHGRHYLEVIGDLGVRRDTSEDHHENRLGASIGIGYGFQF